MVKVTNIRPYRQVGLHAGKDNHHMLIRTVATYTNQQLVKLKQEAGKITQQMTKAKDKDLLSAQRQTLEQEIKRLETLSEYMRTLYGCKGKDTVPLFERTISKRVGDRAIREIQLTESPKNY